MKKRSIIILFLVVCLFAINKGIKDTELNSNSNYVNSNIDAIVKGRHYEITLFQNENAKKEYDSTIGVDSNYRVPDTDSNDGLPGEDNVEPFYWPDPYSEFFRQPEYEVKYL